MNKNDKMKFIRLIKDSGLSISGALTKYDVLWSNLLPLEAEAEDYGRKGTADNKPKRHRSLESAIALAGREDPGICPVLSRLLQQGKKNLAFRSLQ